MAIIRPSSDIVTGWTSTGANSYGVIDEVTADNADYISASSAGLITRVGLGSTTDPGVDTGHVLRYRADHDNADGRGVIARVVQTGSFPFIVTSKQPWRKQPQTSVEMDWSNPLTRGLKLWQLPANGANYLNTQSSRTKFGEDSKTTITRMGWAYGHSLSSYGVATTTNANTANAHTIFTLGYATDGTQYAACGFRNSINSIPNSVFISLGGVPFYRAYIQSADRTFSADSTPAINAYYTFAGVNTGTAQACYLNGVQQSATGSYTGGGLGGWNYWNTYSPNSKQALSLFWDRALSAAEVASISSNPWQIFRTLTRSTYVDLGRKVIAERTPSLTTSPADYTIDLTTGEAATITDYSNLAIEVEST